MAFKINTYVSLPATPIEPPNKVPPTEIKPPEESEEKPDKEDDGNATEETKKPTTTSNSAFSSLSLSTKEWLEKEFGITEETLKENVPSEFLEALLSKIKSKST